MFRFYLISIINTTSHPNVKLSIKTRTGKCDVLSIVTDCDNKPSQTEAAEKARDLLPKYYHMVIKALKKSWSCTLSHFRATIPLSREKKNGYHWKPVSIKSYQTNFLKFCWCDLRHARGSPFKCCAMALSQLRLNIFLAAHVITKASCKMTLILASDCTVGRLITSEY